VEKHPSAAKAGANSVQLSARLKSCPFKGTDRADT
jgi:hypothetical protein